MARKTQPQPSVFETFVGVTGNGEQVVIVRLDGGWGPYQVLVGAHTVRRTYEDLGCAVNEAELWTEVTK